MTYQEPNKGIHRVEKARRRGPSAALILALLAVLGVGSYAVLKDGPCPLAAAW